MTTNRRAPRRWTVVGTDGRKATWKHDPATDKFTWISEWVDVATYTNGAALAKGELGRVEYFATPKDL
jgi:hypothetical protein